MADEAQRQAEAEQVSRIPATPGNENSVETVAQNLFESLSQDPDFSGERIDEEGGGSPGDPDQEAGEFEEEEFEEFEESFEDDDFADDVDDEFGDEDDEYEDDTEPELHTFKANGEEMEVPYDKLLEYASAGVDYTRKTQELAEERKTTQQEREEAAKARQQYGELVGKLADTLENQMSDNVDWARLRQENPAEYAAKYAEHKQRQEELQALRAEQARVMQAQAQEMMQEQTEKLLNAVPEWQENPETMKQELNQLYDTAQNVYGFTDEELEYVSDHRALLILRDAARYRELASKSDKVKRKKKESKNLEPGPRVSQKGKRRRKNRKKVQADRERLAKTGRKEDAARLFMNMDLD